MLTIVAVDTILSLPLPTIELRDRLLNYFQSFIKVKKYVNFSKNEKKQAISSVTYSAKKAPSITRGSVTVNALLQSRARVSQCATNSAGNVSPRESSINGRYHSHGRISSTHRSKEGVDIATSILESVDLDDSIEERDEGKIYDKESLFIFILMNLRL